MVEVVQKKTGAENIVWDLSVYYSSPDDPKIEKDLAEVDTMVKAFVKEYRGKVASLTAEEIGEAYERTEAIYELIGRAGNYAGLNFTVFSTDSKWGAFNQKVTEKYSEIQQQMVFFGLEWNEMDDARAAELLKDNVLRSYRYHLEVERQYKPYQLSEAEEKLLIEKSVTGNNAWTRFFSQIMASIQV